MFSRFPFRTSNIPKWLLNTTGTLTLCFSSLCSVSSWVPSSLCDCRRASPLSNQLFRSIRPVSRDSIFGNTAFICFTRSGISLRSLTSTSFWMLSDCSISVTTSCELSFTRDWAVFVVTLKSFSIEGIWAPYVWNIHEEILFKVEAFSYMLKGGWMAEQMKVALPKLVTFTTFFT